MQTHSIAERPRAGIQDAEASAAWWVLSSLSLSMFLSALGTSITNVGLPALAVAFQARFPDLQWIALAYLVSVTALVVVAGRLGDLYGRRRVLLAGIALFTAASGVCGFASNLGVLVAARALQGAGAAFMMALTLALASEAVPQSKRGRAIGLLGSMSAVGTAVGPALGGLLVASLGWRSLFFVHVPLGLAALHLTRRHLPADRRAPKARDGGMNTPGMVLLTLGVTSYALAMTTVPTGFGLAGVMLLAGAVGSTGLFLRVDSRSASPVLPVSMLRLPGLTLRLGMNLVVSMVMMGALVIGPFHLTRALGVDGAWVGVALAVGPIVAALVSGSGGRLVDLLGTERMTVVGLSALGIGAGVLSAAPNELGVAGYLTPMVVMTSGYALFQTANTTAVVAGSPADQRGVVSGLIGLSRHLGFVTGASLMAGLFAFAAGTAELAEASAGAVGGATRASFSLAAMVLLVALVLAFGNRGRAVG